MEYITLAIALVAIVLGADNLVSGSAAIARRFGISDFVIGAIIVGIGIPALSYEREAISAYYNEKYEEGKQFAYIYPGMNRVLQAAGRVIRREEDRGVVVLIDDRYADERTRMLFPPHWSHLEYARSATELAEIVGEFWEKLKK